LRGKCFKRVGLDDWLERFGVQAVVPRKNRYQVFHSLLFFPQSSIYILIFLLFRLQHSTADSIGKVKVATKRRQLGRQGLGNKLSLKQLHASTFIESVADAGDSHTGAGFENTKIVPYASLWDFFKAYTELAKRSGTAEHLVAKYTCFRSRFNLLKSQKKIMLKHGQVLVHFEI